MSAHMLATMGLAAMQCQRASHLVCLLQLALNVALPRKRLASVLHRCGRLRLGLALLPPHALQFPQRALGLPLHAQ